MSRRVVRILLLVAVLVGWGLALARLGERSLWADEGWTAYTARNASSIGLLRTFRLDPVQGPLYMLLVTRVMRLGGSEFVLRFPSAVAATLAIPVVYLLGRRLMGRNAGLVAAFLHSTSPYLVEYAQEARPYALLECLSCLSLLLLLEAQSRNRWFWWMGFSVSSALLLYTHYFAWFVVGAEYLFALLVLLRSSRARRRLDARLAYLAASGILVLAFYLPWLPVLLAFWREAGPGGSPTLAAGLARFHLSLRFLRDMLAVYGSRSYGWQVYLFGAAIVLGGVKLAFGRKWETLLLVGLWFALPLAVLSAFSTAHFFDLRYVIFFVPVLLLLAAEGVTVVRRLLGRLAPQPQTARLAPVLTLGLAVALFLPANYPGLRDHFHWEKENWRGISSFIRSNVLAGDAIYVSPRYWSNPLLYYQPSLGERLVGGSAEDVNQLILAAQRQPGLWFVRYSGTLGDPSGELTSWIAEHGYVLLIDAKACGYGIHVYSGRTGDDADARLAALIEKAAKFCPIDARFGRIP